MSLCVLVGSMVPGLQVRQPALLLLDEPLAGLDWMARKEVVAILKRLKVRSRIAMLRAPGGVGELRAKCTTLTMAAAAAAGRPFASRQRAHA